ncbi:hypothetical protein Lal_00003799 [Lupinus albus]|nr:hypothetical protein Lal_00003799 [Lupinus albus]
MSEIARVFEVNDLQNRSLIDKYLRKQDRIWRFSSEIEDHYIAHSARIKLRPSLIGFGICLIMFNLGLIWDNHVRPEIFPYAMAIRVFGVTIPCLCVGWLLLCWKNYRMHDWLLSGSMLLIALAINTLAILREAPVNHQAFLVSLLLIVSNIILQLRTVPAVVTSICICAITTAFMWPALTTTSQSYWQAASYMYITAVITLLANTRLDSTMRRLYLMMLKEQIRHEEISRENEELSAFSYTDPLTGIANRRRMEQALRTAWTSADANGSSLALLIIDIDHFKRFNDTYGHPAGDACLKLVAGAIAGQVRQMTDLTARMGGEEFAVLMPGADEKVAELIATRVHLALVNAQTDNRARKAPPSKNWYPPPTRRSTPQRMAAVTRQCWPLREIRYHAAQALQSPRISIVVFSDLNPFWRAHSASRWRKRPCHDGCSRLLSDGSRQRRSSGFPDGGPRPVPAACRALDRPGEAHGNRDREADREWYRRSSADPPETGDPERATGSWSDYACSLHASRSISMNDPAADRQQADNEKNQRRDHDGRTGWSILIERPEQAKNDRQGAN